MNLQEESLIIDSLNKKDKHTLKKFECYKCGQLYIYIVNIKTTRVNCNICDTEMVSKGD